MSKVEFYVDGVLQGAANQYPYRFIIDTQSLAEGSHTLMARAYDVSGNAANSEPTRVNLRRDQEAGTVIADRTYGRINVTWYGRELYPTRRLELWVLPDGNQEAGWILGTVEGAQDQNFKQDTSVQTLSSYSTYEFRLLSVDKTVHEDQRMVDRLIVLNGP